VFRHRGIGSRILAETEKLARAKGYSRVILTAYSLEDYPQERLIAWYWKHGFRVLPNQSRGEMAKTVSWVTETRKVDSVYQYWYTPR
jgi:GNAT superfamily N-acetyltransferase